MSPPDWGTETMRQTERQWDNETQTMRHRHTDNETQTMRHWDTGTLRHCHVLDNIRSICWMKWNRQAVFSSWTCLGAPEQPSWLMTTRRLHNYNLTSSGRVFSLREILQKSGAEVAAPGERIGRENVASWWDSRRPLLSRQPRCVLE